MSYIDFIVVLTTARCRTAAETTRGPFPAAGSTGAAFLAQSGGPLVHCVVVVEVPCMSRAQRRCRFAHT